LEQEVGGPRVAVAWLAHRAGVQKPTSSGEVDDPSVRREAASEVITVEDDRNRHMAVADKYERRRRRLQGPPGRLLAQDVLPHRVPGAAVEELDAVGPRARLEPGEKVTRARLEHSLRPPRRSRRVAGEVVDR